MIPQPLLQFQDGMEMEMDLNRMFTVIIWRKLGSVIFVCAAMMTLSNTPVLVGQAPNRFWSDNSGTFSTEAQLLKINSATVTLRKTNQVVIEVPFSRLSQIDLDFVKNEIRRLNGIAPKTIEQFGPVSPAQPNISSRSIGEHAIVASEKTSQSNISSLQLTPEAAPRPPLRYGAKPIEFQPEPLVGAEPIMPDLVPAVIPTKDAITSPPSDVARLVPPVKPRKEFSLGHTSLQKAPIILKSPQVAGKEKEPARKSLLEIKSSLMDPHPSPSPTTSPSTDDLRSQPFVFDPKRALPTEFSPDKTVKPPLNVKLKPKSFGSKAFTFEKKKEPSDNYQPPSAKALESDKSGSPIKPPTNTSDFPSNVSSFEFEKPINDFSPEPFGDKDPAIVVISNEESVEKPDANPTRTETERKKTSSSKRAAFSFEEGLDEVAHVFSRPPAFGPRKTSFKTSANPDFVANAQSLAELPPRLRTLVTQMVNSKNPTEIRAGLSEIRSSWPSTRYSPLVKVVQACVKAPEATTRILAIETLALCDQEKSLEHILSGIDDISIDVREATHIILEKLSDPRIIPLLARRLDSNQRVRVAGTLSKLGPNVEAHVIPFATHSSLDVQLSACNILGSIGTEQGIRVLQTVVASSKKARVRVQASNAIDRIYERLSK